MINNKYDVDDYIKEQLSQGQTTNAMVEHILYDRIDIETYITTKEYGLSCNITNMRKKKLITQYVKEI